MREARIVSARFDIENMDSLGTALLHGAYSTLEKALSRAPSEIVEQVCESGLRGKGGGGAPVCGKWRMMLEEKYAERPGYLVVNADESEPGTFKDREIIRKDPHLLIEGIILGCYAIGAHDAYIYIRGEYFRFQKILQRAIDEAYEHALLGEDAAGSGYRVDITIHRGAGAYICGEKTALLESLEGKRGHPRLKAHGREPEWYFGNPALVDNVETMASIPFIVENGAAAYREYGTGKSPGTLLFAVSGHVKRPGVYEAEFGTPMWEYIEHYAGGMREGSQLQALIPGGASTPVLTPEEVMRATLDYESLRSLGSALGTGGMIVMDRSVYLPEALKNLLEFYRYESCGQCTPCREGTAWVDNLCSELLSGGWSSGKKEKLLELCDTMNGKTICVFAPAVAGVIEGFVKKFPELFSDFAKAGI